MPPKQQQQELLEDVTNGGGAVNNIAFTNTEEQSVAARNTNQNHISDTHQHQQQNDLARWWFFFLEFPSRPAVLYTTVFAWISVTGGRFLAVFLEHECGAGDAASPQTIGLLLALQAAVSAPASAVLGRASDRCERRYPGRGRVGTVAVGIVVGTITFCMHGLHRILSRNEDDDKGSSRFTLTSLAWYAGLRIIYAVSVSGVFPVLDGICLQYLEQQAQQQQNNDGDVDDGSSSSSNKYGQERLYGAISWAITNVVMAPVLDQIGFGVMYPLAVVSGGAVLLSLYVYSRLNNSNNNSMPSSSKYTRLKKRSSDLPVVFEDDDEEEEDERIHHVEETVGKKQRVVEKSSTAVANNEYTTKQLMKRLLFGTTTSATENDRAWYFGCAFLFAVLLLASGQVIVESLVFLFFEYLGSSYTIMGWTIVLTVAFEIPIFHISDTLLQRFGATSLLQAAMIAYMTRVVGYTLIPQGHVAYALVLEPLHGVTYACSTTAAVDFCASAMPVGYEATGQGWVYVIKSTGSVVGLLLGGWAQDALGPRVLYRCAAAVVTVASVVLGAATFWQRQQHQQNGRCQRVPQNDENEMELAQRRHMDEADLCSLAQ